MKKENYLRIIFGFSLIGVLFSGYLSVTKLMGACPIKEGCPYFLGYPACMFGFVMYLIILIASSFLLFKKPKEDKKVKKTMLVVSVLGFLFALYFSVKELIEPACLGGQCEYTLLLPTCVYGLIMFTTVMVFSFLYSCGKK